MTQEQTGVTEDLTFSVKTQQALDDRARQAFNKINALHVAAMTELDRKVIANSDDPNRSLRDNYPNREAAQRHEVAVLQGQENYMALLEGRGYHPANISLNSFNRLSEALLNPTVAIYEIAPSFKGTKEDLHNAAHRAADLAWAFLQLDKNLQSLIVLRM